MRFESLARKANNVTENEEMSNMFLQGLPKSLLWDTLEPLIPLNYNEAKERVKLLAQGRAVIKGILKKNFSVLRQMSAWQVPDWTVSCSGVQ